MQPHHRNRVFFARYQMILTLAGCFNENEGMHRLIHGGPSQLQQS